jgi:hypothetical protein
LRWSLRFLKSFSTTVQETNATSPKTDFRGKPGTLFSTAGLRPLDLVLPPRTTDTPPPSQSTPASAPERLRIAPTETGPLYITPLRGVLSITGPRHSIPFKLVLIELSVI